MKKVLKNKIINIEWTDKFDSKFLFSVLFLNHPQPLLCKEGSKNIKIINISDLLEDKKNLEMLEKSKVKPASYSNVYSPKDELEIFKNIFNQAIEKKQKVHIVWITLKEEVEILEEYYTELWFFNEDINCFDVDFSKVLVSASVKIENLMWRWSDYKRMWSKIFFNPPIRESWEVKAMFKWINRWSIAGIAHPHPQPLPNKEGRFSLEIIEFFQKQILEENILPINLSKVLNYNLSDFGIKGEEIEMIIEY